MSAHQHDHEHHIRLDVIQESPVRHALNVVVDASEVSQAFDRAYRELGKRARVKGFRPGKIPRSVLAKMYGASVASDLEHELVAHTLADAIEQSGLEPVSQPAIDARNVTDGEEFRYTAHVEVKPEIELPDLAGLPAQAPKVEVSDEDIDRELEGLRQRHAPVLEEPPETPVGPDHILSIDFVGRVDDKPLPGGNGRGVELEMAANAFPEGFADQLVGAVVGDDREVRVSFPEDHPNEELRGKRAEFQVHVVEVKRRHVPALDDEFAKDLGDEFENLEQLRNRVHGDLVEMRERGAREALHRSLMDALIERTSFEVPPGMVERERDRRLESARRRLQGAMGEDAIRGQLAHWKEAWREEAEREVRATLLLQAVADQQGLSAGDEEVEAKIEELASEQGVPARRLREAMDGEALDAAIRARLVEEKALEFLRTQAKVEETTDT